MSSDARSVRDHLQSARFLDGVASGDVDKLAAIGCLEHVDADSVLFAEGTVHQQMYLVSSGLIRLEMCMPRRGCVCILTVGPGEIVGWSALLGDGRIPARATAVEGATLVALPAPALQQLCEADHDVGYAVMKQVSVSMSNRLLATRLQMLDLSDETRPIPPPVSHVPVQEQQP